MDSETKLKAARLKLLVKSDLYFFGSLILPYRLLIYRGQGTAAIDSTGTEKTIWISDEFISQFSPDELAFILCHEVCHVLQGHGLRSTKHLTSDLPKDVTRRYSLLAADHCVNELLFKCTQLTAPKETFYISDLEPNMTYEQVFKWLVKNIEIEKVSWSITVGNGTEDSGDNSNEKETDQLSVESLQLKRKDTGETIDAVISETKISEEATSEAKSIARSILSRGLVDASAFEVLKKTCEVELPWDQLFEDAINSTCQHLFLKTWKYLNKRLRMYCTLPGVKPNNSDRYGIHIVVLDTSGSISSRTLESFFHVLFKTSRQFEKLIIIQHSVRVKKVQELETHELFDEKDLLERAGKIVGRGGTSHHEAFEKVAEIYEDKMEQVSVVSCLTDLYSDLESCWTKFNWVKELPVIFIVPDSVSETHIDRIKTNLTGNVKLFVAKRK